MGRDMSKEDSQVIIFRPISIFYFILMFLITIILLPFMITAWRIFSYSLKVSPIVVLIVFIASLICSYINIRVGEIRVREPIVVYREISFFGIRWYIPEVRYGTRTIVTVNVGGALIPVLFSLYLLFNIVPRYEANVSIAYLKILVAFTLVTIIVYSVARPIEGLGIATPSLIPPLSTALISLFLYPIYIKTNPFIIAYVSGTLGTLVGADILNLNKIPKLRSPIVSIGGAGTFDGIYITGVVAVFLIWLLI